MPVASRSIRRRSVPETHPDREQFPGASMVSKSGADSLPGDGSEIETILRPNNAPCFSVRQAGIRKKFRKEPLVTKAFLFIPGFLFLRALECVNSRQTSADHAAPEVELLKKSLKSSKSGDSLQ